MAITKLSTKFEILDYWDFKEKIAGQLLKSNVAPSIDNIFSLATTYYSLDPDLAAEHIEHFMIDINRSLKTI